MAERSNAHDETAEMLARHGQHDLELVAAHAAGDAVGEESKQAQVLLDTCDACANLARDLRSITNALNESRAATPVTAPRDFRLTPADAARLRPASPLARFREGVAMAFGSFGRPVGATLATFGVVGLLVGSVGLGGQPAAAPAAPGASAAAAATGREIDDGTAAGLPAATDGFAVGQPAASDLDAASLEAGATNRLTMASGASPETTTQPTDDDQAAGGGAAPAGSGPTVSSWLMSGSMVLLVLGLGLVVLGPRARRRAA